MAQPQFMTIRQDTSLAFRHDGKPDTANGPTGLFWLGGFMSDMEGSKAQTLADLAIKQDRPNVRFDYSGHGQSTGQFRDGTISKWLEESVAVFKGQTCGPRVIIGSSMGGWLALLMYRYLQAASPQTANRIKGLVLIAPAADMTTKLMWDKYDDPVRREITKAGFFAEPSAYGDQPYIITRQLIQDGKQHSLLEAGVEVSCPVRILQGEEDPDVSWQHGLEVYRAIAGDDVTFSLIKSGDHRLSTPRDLEILRQTCRQLFALAEHADGGKQGG